MRDYPLVGLVADRSEESYGDGDNYLEDRAEMLGTVPCLFLDVFLGVFCRGLAVLAHASWHLLKIVLVFLKNFIKKLFKSDESDINR